MFRAGEGGHCTSLCLRSTVRAALSIRGWAEQHIQPCVLPIACFCQLTGQKMLRLSLLGFNLSTQLQDHGLYPVGPILGRTWALIFQEEPLLILGHPLKEQQSPHVDLVSPHTPCACISSCRQRGTHVKHTHLLKQP